MVTHYNALEMGKQLVRDSIIMTFSSQKIADEYLMRFFCNYEN